VKGSLIPLRRAYTAYSSGIVRNNMIVGIYHDSFLLEYVDYNDSTKKDPVGHVIIDHNLFYSADEYNSITIFGTRCVRANPLLLSPIDDFRLADNSPAVYPDPSPSVHDFDHIGADRPQGSASASKLPSGASFHASTRAFDWTPNTSQAGTYAGTHFTVSDGNLSA
jgi:hypothetical protein